MYLGIEAKRTQISEDGVQLLKTFSFCHWDNIEVDILIAAAKNPKREQEHGRTLEASSTITPKRIDKTWFQAIRESVTAYIEQFLKVNTILPAVLHDDHQTPFDEDRLRSALKFLTQMGMLTYHTDSDSYGMHTLVHTWVRERPETSTGEQAIWCQAAATILVSCIFFKSPIEYAALDEKLRIDIFPHVENVRKAHKIIRERIAENKKTHKHSRLISWLAIPMISSEIQPIEWAKFSLVYLQAGKWEEAEELQLKVKELACARLGMEHPRTIDIMQLLSITYGLQARNSMASKLLRQALEACTKLYGNSHPKTIKVIDTLGATCLQQSRLNEARILHEQAIRGMTEVLGAEHEDTLIAVDNLGKVMSRYLLYNEAKDLHLRAFSGMKKMLGHTHLHTLQAMEHLALSHMYLGDLDIALELAHEVLAEREKKVGKEHPYTLMAKLKMARVKSARNENEEAETIIRTGLPIGERNLGDNHLGVLLARTWLAQVLLRRKKYCEAEEILTSVIQRHRYEGSRREDGEHVEHVDRIQALWFLLRCYHLQGKIQEAILISDELWEAIQTISGEGLGMQHNFAKLLAEKREELLAVKQDSNSESSPNPYDLISSGSRRTEESS